MTAVNFSETRRRVTCSVEPGLLPAVNDPATASRKRYAGVGEASAGRRESE